MNKFFLSTLLLPAFLCMGCGHKPEKSVETTFYTQDSLYQITFDKPVELDTFYSWLDADDNPCSDEHKYRFSKSGFPAQKESGFFWTSFADSTYRITLKHVEDYACGSEMDHEKMMAPGGYLKRIYDKSKSDNPNVHIDTLYSKSVVVNDRDFVMYAYRIQEDFYITNNFTTGYWTTYLKALTLVDDNLLVFTADCRMRNCDGFISRMEESLQTIKIEKRTK